MKSTSKIEFKKGFQSGQPDIEISKMESLSHLSKILQDVIGNKKENDKIVIVLLPPIPGSISIPLSIKVVMSSLEELEEKSLSLMFYIQGEEIIDHLYRYLPNDLRPTSEYKIGSATIVLRIANIIEVKAEAIVNASNRNFKLGGGVSGSIKRAANPNLQTVLNKLAFNNPIQDGDVVLTESFGIQGIKYIIHAAAVTGTVDVLRRSLTNIFELCEQKMIKSVAIPALGTGVGGLDLNKCAEVFLKVLEVYFTKNPDTVINRVEIILWKKNDYDTFKVLTIKFINEFQQAK